MTIQEIYNSSNPGDYQMILYDLFIQAKRGQFGFAVSHDSITPEEGGPPVNQGGGGFSQGSGFGDGSIETWSRSIFSSHVLDVQLDPFSVTPDTSLAWFNNESQYVTWTYHTHWIEAFDPNPRTLFPIEEMANSSYTFKLTHGGRSDYSQFQATGPFVAGQSTTATLWPGETYKSKFRLYRPRPTSAPVDQSFLKVTTERQLEMKVNGNVVWSDAPPTTIVEAIQATIPAFGHTSPWIETTPQAAAQRSRTVELLPVELKAFKRGTLNVPGAKVPTGTGEFGDETVMMENADSESSATSTSRDCDESGASADLNAYRKATDDDLVKIVLKWPVGMKPAGASLKLLHDGMQVDATQTTADAAVITSGPSRVNFYKADGTRITDPATDLQISDLANAPASSYLSKILTDGEVTIFIEGADRFGDLPEKRITRLGGAQLRWQFTHGATIATAKLLIYRGGFLRFMQSAGAPGTVGDFEFWDGKGRVKNKVGKPIFGKEFETDVTDYGTKLATWKAKSGKTKNNPEYPGGPYNKEGKFGHTPPGWWRQCRSTKKWTNSQQDESTGSGATKKTEQGGYVRWKQDDETDPAKQYTKPYRYDASLTKDQSIGNPVGIKFKYDMDPIDPSDYQDRSAIQIHPDGECNDNVMGGTAGCIGIQTYKYCE